jgi:CBS domain-containing protein
MLERHARENAMRARDIMSSPVIAVAPHTPVLEIAALLHERRIGGVPVLADAVLVGIVTGRDLLHRHELGTQERSRANAWWHRVVTPELEPDWYVKSHGRCAEHVMTRIVHVAQAHSTLAEVVALFDRHRVGRLPVVRGERVVGIVTAADLVRSLARGSWVDADWPAGSSDAEIRDRIVSELRRQDWWNSGSCAVDVRDGVAHFSGFVENEAQRLASRIAAENTPGVRAVEDDRTSLGDLPILF